MKTTSLILSMLLFSAAISAQTTVKNSESVNSKTAIQASKSGTNVKNDGSVSSSTSIHSQTMKNAGDKSQAEIKEANKVAGSERQSLEVSSRTTARRARMTVSRNRTAAASASADANSHGSVNGSHYNSATSVKGSGAVSTTGLENRTTHLKNAEVSRGKAQIKASTSEGNKMKASVSREAGSARRVRVASSSTVKSGVSAHAFHPKPVSIKTGTMVRAAGGIKIK